MYEPEKVEMWEKGSKFLWEKEECWPREPPGLGQLPAYYDDFKAQEEAYNKVQLPPIEDTCTRSLAASLLTKSATDLPSHTSKDPTRTLLSHFSKWIPLCKSVAWFMRLQI